LFLRLLPVVLISLILTTDLLADNPPLQLSLRFPDVSAAAVTGTEALVLNPAALFVNQEPAVMALHSFGKDEFSGDNAFLISAAGLGFGYQKLALNLGAGVSRYDFAASSRLMRNFYTGLSYTYYKTDWKTLDKAHAWNYSLLYHAARMAAFSFQAQNINKHRFDGEKSSIHYSFSAALRPKGEVLTIGTDFSMYSGQKLDQVDWRVTTRANVRKGLALFAAIDNRGRFGVGLELHFGRAISGGESFFDNDAKYTGSTMYGGFSASTREQIIRHYQSILHVDLSGEIPEESIKPFLWKKSPPTVYQKISKIQAAKSDPQISGLLLTVRNPAIGWGRIADFREAVKEFRSAGKPVVAYLGASAGNGSYYLASAADKIYMLPVDALYLTGLRAQVTFYKGAMDKLGVEAEMERSGNYKSYPEVFTDTTLSPQFREAIEVLLDDLYDQIIDDVAADRHFQSGALRATIDQGPFTSTQAESLRLVNGRFYSHELEAKVPEMFGAYYGIVSESNYRNYPAFRDRFGEPPAIALITVEGGIVRGASGYDYFEGSTVGSGTVVAAIRTARNDAAVKAIVVRLNTPGGDAIASDLIWGELSEARKTKPVIVSMSDACASGGYYIASASDQILLQNTTVTGSIGVFAGKANLAGLYSKLGLHTETITRGKHANMFSLTQPYSDEERSLVRRQVMDMNVRFTTIVADGRMLAIDSVAAIAQGRVWSGKRALALGLADSLGSVLDAIDLARRKAQISDNDFVVLEMPQRRLIPRLTNLALSGLAKTMGLDSHSALASLRASVPLSPEANLQMRIPWNLTIE
jgi:protease-4